MTEGARIGYQIRKLRLMSGQTQENVANSLEISLSYLRRIEQGRANPSVNMAAKIIACLVAEIVGRPQEIELFHLDTLFESMAVWRYRLVNETQFASEIGWFPTYGICAEERRRGAWCDVMTLHDVVLDRTLACRIVERLNSQQLSPVHFQEAVQNMLE